MESTLDTWLAAEAAQRQRLAGGAGPGFASPAVAAQLSGLGLLQAMQRGELPFSHIGQTLDFMLIEVEHGRAVFQGTPGVAHLNPMGAVHGGWFATLELKVNLIRALTPKVQRVRAEGRVIHLGGQTATADARLVGPDGKLYAHGSTTCLVFNIPPQSRP
jgi:acyl-coenzyme A thioesterase PaaI-like protein